MNKYENYLQFAKEATVISNGKVHNEVINTIKKYL